MKSEPTAIELRHLVRRYGRTEAVQGLNLQVRPGRCYGFFGRNGAGKTTTIKCLLNLLRPDSGLVRVFGLDPRQQELEIKKRIAYVPDQVAFYPWMTVQDTLHFQASFRPEWNATLEQDLLDRFGLDPRQKTSALSKGQRTQLALIGAISAGPELLILDEPTSGLDPLVRKEFIETVIGAYQAERPGERTIFVSTHLISEFEGLIDEFTIIEHGREILSMEADAARQRFQRIRVRFNKEVPAWTDPEVLRSRQLDWETELLVRGPSPLLLEKIKLLQPESLVLEPLSLEEIFVASVGERKVA